MFQYQNNYPESPKKNIRNHPNQFSNTKLRFSKNVRFSIIKPSFLEVEKQLVTSESTQITSENKKNEQKKQNIDISNKKKTTKNAKKKKNINISDKNNKKYKNKLQNT